jgi:hypothetical protein
MIWKKNGASNVIALRTLVLSDIRWKQFLNKITLVGTFILNLTKQAVKK